MREKKQVFSDNDEFMKLYGLSAMIATKRMSKQGYRNGNPKRIEVRGK